MSFCHLRLSKTFDDSAEAIYRIESPDFEESNEWKEIGQLRLDKRAGRYEFSQSGPLLKHRIVPPWVYGLNQDEQTKLLQTDYKEHDCGAWTMRIHYYASTFLQENNYPERHPESFFGTGQGHG